MDRNITMRIKRWTAACLLALAAGGVAAQQLPADAGRLLYAASLADTASVSGWVMEGPGVLSFRDGWMEMYSPGEKWDHVLWCPRVFPADFIAEWDIRVLKDEGLAIVFFAATGPGGRSIFDPSLPKRDGTFRYYNRGLIHCYHISYYADNPKHPDRGDSHLRKDPGAVLLVTGAEGIAPGDRALHHVRLVKRQGRITMEVDGRRILSYSDNGGEHGPVYGAGRIGFRQMRWSRIAYRNFKVWTLKKTGAGMQKHKPNDDV